NGDATVSNDLTIEGSLILGGESYTSFSGGGALSTVTENGNTGVRLSSSDAANHGDIGDKAVDLSYSSSESTTEGATGSRSTAMGFNTEASGNTSTAMGNNTTASGFASTASGDASTASGDASTAMGRGTTASGYVSTAMGQGPTASGNYSTAMGYRTTASDYASVIIGQYNSSGSSVTNSATSFNRANTAFVIGNGEDDTNLSDAFKVMFNGDATVSNDLTVNGDVTVSSDARLKANIVSLGATLSKLLNIDGKTYTIKKNGKQKIGVLAQDIQEVFPELVSEDKEGMLSVNYQGLIPVLINALKEQEEKIVKQQTEINHLKAQETKLLSQEADLKSQEIKLQIQEEKIVKQQTEINRLKAQEKIIESQEERLKVLERILSKE
ncbi:MAG: hypothetical protein CMC19_10900, partial [Flavobacteriaceae bacterium]|nr:hypothetical protein [Flavobacteriaceae bacterium]